MDFQSMMANFKSASKHASSSNDTSPAKRQKHDKCFYHADNSLSTKPIVNKIVSKNILAANLVAVERYFLICPSGVETGGPEAMHQMCDMINRESKSRGKNSLAHMIYLKERGNKIFIDSNARKPDPYDEYDAPLHKEYNIPFTSCDLVIWPECWTCYIDSFPDQSRNLVQKAIWWLSVNNNRSTFQDWNRVDVLHFYQSEYARAYLQKNNTNADMMAMTEYIPKRRIPLLQTVKESHRDVDVVYNPLKGMHFTDKIIKRSGRKISFKPIGGNGQRLTPKEVTKLLLRSKIFIDFGPHPGMDRLPREAALCGCIVMTNRCGSAQFFADVPIPIEYKNNEEDIDGIHKLLISCINKFTEKHHDFNNYREWIGKQEIVMRDCINQMIDRISEDR